MPSNTNTTSNLNYILQTFYDKKFLENLKQDLQFATFAKQFTVPKGFGPTVQFTRYVPQVGVTTAITEGTTPTDVALVTEKVNATVAQYAQYTAVTDWLLNNHISGYSPFVEDAVTEMAYKAKDSWDLLVRNAFGAASGAYTTFAGSKATGTVSGGTDVATSADVRRIIRTLKKRLVPFYDGSNYIFIIGPDQSFDLQSEAGTGSWLDMGKYTSSTKMEKGEIGKMYGGRFVESTNLKGDGTTNHTATETGIDGNPVYECYAFGKDAVGTVNITETNVNADRTEMKHINLYIKEPGSAGTSDPVNLIGTVGYKFNCAAVRLEDKRVQLWQVGGTI